MTKIMIEVTDGAHGVRVDVRGDLKGNGDAAFVARGMVVYAGALFVSAKPVIISGDAGHDQFGGLMNEQWGDHHE